MNGGNETPDVAEPAGGTDYVYSNDAGTFGVVETPVTADGMMGEPTVIAATGDSAEPAPAANDNEGGGYAA